MNKLVMGSLVAVLASTFAGCIFTSDDTTDPFCGDNIIDPGEACDGGATCTSSCTVIGTGNPTTTNWNFATIAFVGNDTQSTPSACPGGQFDTAAVISQLVDANGTPLSDCSPGTPSNQCFVDLYNCTDMTGTSELPSGTYLRWVAITNTNGSQTYTQTPSAYVTFPGTDTTVTATLYDNGGYFAFDWALRGATTNAALTCVDVAGQTGVGIVSTTVATPTGAVADVFTCTDGRGLTAPLPQGSYTVGVFVDSAGGSIGSAPVQTKTIGAQNQITDLGTVTIPITGR